jgi:hypothetical protein
MNEIGFKNRSQSNANARRRAVYLRAALALVLVPAITSWCVWLVQSSARNAFQQSTPGQIARLYEHVAPQVEERNKQVEDLAEP